MPVLDRLSLIAERLEALSSQAIDTVAKVGQVSTVAAAAAASLEAAATRSSSAEASLTGSADRFLRSSKSLEGELNRYQASVREVAAAVSSELDALEEDVTATAGRINEKTEELQGSTATRLNDLENLLAGSGNAWDVQVAQLIDAVQTGILPLSHLIDLYGDAQVQGQRLVDFLGDLPLTTYSRQIAEFIGQVQDGARGLEDVKNFLAQSNLEFSKQLLAAINLFKEGKGTLEAVKFLVEQIEKLFPDSQLSQLADTILLGLRQGSL